jgi:Sec-independent protein translocase protein TatA
MEPEIIPQFFTPLSILFAVVFGAGKVRSAIDELRRAVDRLDNAVRAIEDRSHDVEQRVARLEGKSEQ